MTIALKILQADPSTDFDSAFSRATGAFDDEAKMSPKKSYTTVEIQELFSYLFDLRSKKVLN